MSQGKNDLFWLGEEIDITNLELKLRLPVCLYSNGFFLLFFFFTEAEILSLLRSISILLETSWEAGFCPLIRDHKGEGKKIKDSADIFQIKKEKTGSFESKVLPDNDTLTGPYA